MMHLFRVKNNETQYQKRDTASYIIKLMKLKLFAFTHLS